MWKNIVFFLVLCCLPKLQYGQTQKENPFLFNASYIGDVYANTAGGLKTGTGYMGMGNLTLGFDTEKAGWWKGGSFLIHGASIHGKSLSEHFTGDLQVVSNIDAGTHVYLHELRFRQDFENFSFTVGLQDLNAEFMTSESGGEFINSSFGVPPVISANIPVPIFPLTGLGIAARWDINETFAWQAALFDGCQKPFEDNPYNLNWNLNKDDGMFLVSEFHSQFRIKDKAATYKLGAYYHSGLKEPEEQTQTQNTVFKNNYGFYLIANQTVFEQDENRRIVLFTQLAVAPKNKNEQDYYLGLGANYHGVFSKKGKDILGLAVAHAGLHTTNHKHETTLEMYYKWQFDNPFAIQPDVQYIINPSGTDKVLKNALACLLRLHVDF